MPPGHCAGGPEMFHPPPSGCLASRSRRMRLRRGRPEDPGPWVSGNGSAELPCGAVAARPPPAEDAASSANLAHWAGVAESDIAMRPMDGVDGGVRLDPVEPHGPGRSSTDSPGSPRVLPSPPRMSTATTRRPCAIQPIRRDQWYLLHDQSGTFGTISSRPR